MSRRGHLLVEALCALALSGVLLAATGLALANTRRALSSIEQTARATGAAREAVSITAALLASADSVRPRGDTAASAAVLIALGAACAIEPSRRAILLPPASVSFGTPLTLRSQPIEAEDVIAVLAVDSLASSMRWIATVVDSVGERTAAAPCGASDGWVHPADAAATRLRLVLRDSLPLDVRVGAPARVTRQGRLSLYHAGSGDWMLGWRRCASDGSGCGAAQPVAGPLATPGRGGLRIRRSGVAGLTVSAKGVAASVPESLWLALRGEQP